MKSRSLSAPLLMSWENLHPSSHKLNFFNDNSTQAPTEEESKERNSHPLNFLCEDTLAEPTEEPQDELSLPPLAEGSSPSIWSNESNPPTPADEMPLQDAIKLVQESDLFAQKAPKPVEEADFFAPQLTLPQHLAKAKAEYWQLVNNYFHIGFQYHKLPFGVRLWYNIPPATLRKFHISFTPLSDLWHMWRRGELSSDEMNRTPLAILSGLATALQQATDALESDMEEDAEVLVKDHIRPMLTCLHQTVEFLDYSGYAFDLAMNQYQEVRELQIPFRMRHKGKRIGQVRKQMKQEDALKQQGLVAWRWSLAQATANLTARGEAGWGWQG
jgi:hypothetical protein